MKIKKLLADVPCETKDFRNFGWVVGGIFTVLGGLFLWRHKGHPEYLLTPGVLLIVLGTLVPKILRPVYLAWMLLGLLMGEVVSRIILTILYFVAITPIALISRWTGKKFLDLEFKNTATSYWNERKPIPDIQKHSEVQY